jgi:hypothetical protein
MGTYNLTFLLSAVFPIYRYTKWRKLAESSNVVLPTPENIGLRVCLWEDFRDSHNNTNSVSVWHHQTGPLNLPGSNTHA